MADDPKEFRTVQQPQPMSAGQIFNAVLTIHNLGLDEAFLKSCDDKGLSVVFPAEVINYVKDFIDANVQLPSDHRWSSAARNIVYSPGGRCPDRHGG